MLKLCIKRPAKSRGALVLAGYPADVVAEASRQMVAEYKRRIDAFLNEILQTGKDSKEINQWRWKR